LSQKPWDTYNVLWNMAPAALQDLVARHAGKWVLDTETDGLMVRGRDSRHSAWYVGLTPLGTRTCIVYDKAHWPDAKPVVEQMQLIGQNMRFDVHAADLNVQRWEDTLGYSYFNSMSALKGLDDLARRRRRPKIKTPKGLKGPKLATNRIAELEPAKVGLYLADDCIFTGEVYQDMQKPDLAHDQALERVVANMEMRGVRIYPDRLDEFEALAIETESQVRSELAGFGFDGNPGSPKQVLTWLGTFMDTSKLPPTKTSRSTGSKALKNIHLPQTEALLAVRSAVKLQNGFIASVRAHMTEDGMIYPSVHTSKHDAGGTGTGRWSMSDPPLHQAPKRHPVLGPLARRCITSSTWYTCGADFRQIEPRVAAAMSECPVQLAAFAAGRCPYTETAAVVLGKTYAQVTPTERSNAKAVNLGILNGMGPSGLSIQLGCTLRQARRWLDDYLMSLPTFAEWLEDTKATARTFGVLRTCAGRTRIFGSDESTDTKAVSVVVQGSAAELIRRAVVALDEAGTEPFLQMHDEVLCQNRLTTGQDVATIMTQAANEAFPDVLGAVDFAAKGGEGDSWAAV